MTFADLPADQRRQRAQAAADAEHDRYWMEKKPTRPGLIEIITERDPRHTSHRGPRLTGRAAMRARGQRSRRRPRLTAATSPLVDEAGTLGQITTAEVRRGKEVVELDFRTVLTERGAR